MNELKWKKRSGVTSSFCPPLLEVQVRHVKYLNFKHLFGQKTPVWHEKTNDQQLISIIINIFFLELLQRFCNNGKQDCVMSCASCFILKSRLDFLLTLLMSLTCGRSWSALLLVVLSCVPLPKCLIALVSLSQWLPVPHGPLVFWSTCLLVPWYLDLLVFFVSSLK